METNLQEENKSLVRRFNSLIIEQGDVEAFMELVDKDIINHAAAPGTPNGRESMRRFLLDELAVGFSHRRVEILDQVAEGDKVTTRKALHAVHTGNFWGIKASNKQVVIHIIDIIRLVNGKYVEHWGQSNFAQVIAELTHS